MLYSPNAQKIDGWHIKGTEEIKHIHFYSARRKHYQVSSQHGGNSTARSYSGDIAVQVEENMNEIIPLFGDLVSMWVRSDMDAPEVQQGRTTLMAPSEEVIRQETYEVNLQSIQRLRLTAKIQGLPFKGAGLYHFLVEKLQDDADVWLQVAKIPLYVTRLPSPFDNPQAT